MHASATRPATSARTVTIAFYALCSLVLLALVTKAQKDFLPSVFATQLGHNSESFALALAVGVTIQFLRPRWSSGPSGGATRWGLVLAVAGVWLALALGVYYLGLPPTIKTLNEPLAAAAVLTVYFAPTRPWRLSWVVPVLFVLIVIAAYQLRFVIAQSETVTSVVAVCISTDLAQRSILRPGFRDSARVWAWWAFLAVWPALMLFLNRQDLPGVLGDAVNYQARGAEGFWGALIICLFFALLRHTEREEGASGLGDVHRP